MTFTDILVALTCWTLVSIVAGLGVGVLMRYASSPDDLAMARHSSRARS